MAKLDKAVEETRTKDTAKAIKDSVKSEDVYAIVDELRAQADDICAFWIDYPPPAP